MLKQKDGIVPIVRLCLHFGNKRVNHALYVATKMKKICVLQTKINVRPTSMFVLCAQMLNSLVSMDIHLFVVKIQ